MADPQAIAIVLGRAGSVGLPGKNMMLIVGKPCAQWTIESAQRARSVQTVVVSSDDPMLRDLGAQLGAIAIDRPSELASGQATVDGAARDALVRFERAPGRGALSDSTPIVLLYANVPVRPEGLIDRCVQRLVSTGCDSVQSYVHVGKVHPWWLARVDEQTGSVRPWEGEILNHNVFRRQDLPPAFVPDGGVLVMTRRALMLEVPGAHPGPHQFFGIDRRGEITRPGEVVDIDSKIDAVMAEAILSERARGVERAQ